MALTREKKESIIKEFHKKIENSKSIIFLNFRQISASEVNVLRRAVRAAGGDFRVIKKTLLNKVLGGFGISGDAPSLEGELAVSTAVDEGVELAGILTKGAKTLKGLKILGGILENNYVDGATINSLAAIPPREILYSLFVGAVASPLRRMAGVLSEELRQFVSVLDEISKKR